MTSYSEDQRSVSNKVEAISLLNNAVDPRVELGQHLSVSLKLLSGGIALVQVVRLDVLEELLTETFVGIQ